ncbi:MAG TPA: hypothetical protein IAB01_00795 [Candidatus Avidesulfovibrio excrementigallinarum]|nr:hypothetical protein [Candidatus Avidesulfovibrio excrementigallinarum]
MKWGLASRFGRLAWALACMMAAMPLLRYGAGGMSAALYAGAALVAAAGLLVLWNRSA